MIKLLFTVLSGLFLGYYSDSPIQFLIGLCAIGLAYQILTVVLVGLTELKAHLKG
jgi:hypothetical protein